MPSRRRSLAASDDDPVASSSSPSSPPPAHPPPPAKKKATTASKNNSLTDDRPRTKATTAKGKRKRTTNDDSVEEVDMSTSVAAKGGKAGSKVANGKREAASKKVRLDSDDSDDFIFTKEAYRPPSAASQPLPTKRTTNGKAPALPPKAASQPKASSQPKAKPTTDAKGKKRADPDLSANQDRRAMPPPPLPVPDQPTTPRGKTKLDPILHPSTSREGDSTIELAPAETPMIKRNIAMRQAADAAAPPSSTRRTSFERRGRRGSFVGDGFEGESVPHPSVDDALLHRHINPNELPSTRFLTLISWSAHRQARELASGPASKAREAATRIAEAVLSNISKHGIDVRWADHSGPAAPSKPTRPLQANEANERNRAKGAALDEWAEAMKAEQLARSNVKPRYAALKAPRQPSAALASVSSSSVNYAASNVPALATADDVLRYGRSLLTTAQADPSPPEMSTSVSVEAELDVSMERLRLQASSLKQQTHRTDQFTRLGDSYALTRLASAHRALASLTSGPAPPDTADLLRALTRAEKR